MASYSRRPDFAGHLWNVSFEAAQTMTRTENEGSSEVKVRCFETGGWSWSHRISHSLSVESLNLPVARLGWKRTQGASTLLPRFAGDSRGQRFVPVSWLDPPAKSSSRPW